MSTSNSHGSRPARSKHPTPQSTKLKVRRHRTGEEFRKLRKASVRKSLQFEQLDHHGDQGLSSDKFTGEPTFNNFWNCPPPPPLVVPSTADTTVNRRSLRLRTKSQFPISQIADRHSPKTLTNSTSDLLWRKRTNTKCYVSNNSNVYSDYGTSSERSALYFQPKPPPKPFVVRDKCSQNVQNLTDASSQSIGYASDLDEVLSNLSIDETNGKPAETGGRWESDEDNAEENTMEWELDDGHRNDDHLSLKDLKLSTLKAHLKSFQGIRVLIPLTGYEITRPTKCVSRRSLNNEGDHHCSTTRPCKPIRYDLRRRHCQLENTLTIQTFDVNIEGYFMETGLRIIQVSPVISIQPYEVKFCNLYPAIVQIPLNLEPSAGDEVHCLYSRSSANGVETNYGNIHWNSELAGKFSINDGKVNFETFQFGLFVLVIRPKCPYSSSTKNIRARVGGKLVVSGFPDVEVTFPKEVTEQDILKADAKIYFDTEESVSEFLSNRLTKLHEPVADDALSSNCLATPIIQLEPHGIQFDGEPVMVTLPIPDFDKIQTLLGDKAKLSIWQSNTHSSEPSKWERLEVDFEIRQTKNGGEIVSVVTFPVKHFSFFKGVWDAISNCLSEAKLGMMYYFVSFAMKCQANMQEYPDQQPSTSKTKSNGDEKEEDNDNKEKEKAIIGGSRFGLEVIVFQADKPWPQMATYQYKVGQSNPKLVKPGKICVRLKSHYFAPDVQAGEEEEMVKEESDFRGRDFEKQFICKFKDDVKIERGPFGKVLVSRQPSPRQRPQTIFEFNIQKLGNEGEITTPTDKQSDEWSIVALTELANSLFVTEGDNWKIFAQEIRMTKQEIKDTRLKLERDPFQKIVSHYRQRGGTPQELVDALYRCHRTLKVCGSGAYSGTGSNRTRSSNGSSGRGSLSSNNAHFDRFGSHDSDTSGTQTSQDSGLPPGRKRSLHSHHVSSLRGSGGATSTSSGKLSKRRRMSSQEPGTSTRCVEPTDADEEADTDSDNDNDKIPSSRSQVGSVVVDDRRKNDQRLLNTQFLWQISKHIKVGGSWRTLGRDLGLEEGVLASVEQAYGHGPSAFRECNYQMLLEWKEWSPRKCTFGNLYAALKEQGMRTAAEAMCEIEMEGSTKSST